MRQFKFIATYEMLMDIFRDRVITSQETVPEHTGYTVYIR